MTKITEELLNDPIIKARIAQLKAITRFHTPPQFRPAKCCGTCEYWDDMADTELGDGQCMRHPVSDDGFVVEFINHICDDWVNLSGDFI